MIALEQSYNLARLYDAIVHLVYVVDLPCKVATAVGRGGEEKVMQRKEEARQKLNQLAEGIRAEHKVPVQTSIVSGKVEQAIVQEARSLEASMMVMATTGKSGIKRLLSDSVAYAVVGQAPCPVITVRGQEHRNWCNNILLPLDLSQETTQKVRKTIEIARMFDGSAIHLVSVVRTLDFDALEQLRAQLRTVKAFVEDHNLECHGNLIRLMKGEDNIPSAIMAFAKKIDADLITIMTRQESKTARLFIGSQADTIIRNSLVPVMSMVPEVG